MYAKNDTPPQQWSVHAEFTISHPGVSDPENPPQTQTVQGDNGVRMTYTWTSQANQQNSWSTDSKGPPTAPSATETPQQPQAYGFQKGNLLFTSTPSRRREDVTINNHRLGIHDSGYGSDLLSPNSQGSCLLRRPIQPYNRKCRSTCNIVLSTNLHCENRNEDRDSHTQCGRTQSLRCQTPTLRCDRKDEFYGCGDPWCHHIHYGDDLSARFSPVLETPEDCLSGQVSSKPSRTSTVSTARCCDRSTVSAPRESSCRRDACVQTFEMIDKCTSPFQIGNFERDKSVDTGGKKCPKKKYSAASRRRTEPIFQNSSPSSFTPDSLDSLKVPRRVFNSSPPDKAPLYNANPSKKENGSATESKSSDTSKKPRTVHIDVYCTGTEMESNASSDSSDNDTASTPQTVFESEKVRVTHKRAEDTDLPFNVQKPVPPKLKSSSEDESDDGLSTSYPSKLSSYSTIRDISSSISSVPQSWTTYSMSSCALPDDYDSVANTSWKDTFSDIDSLLQSRSSIAPTESLVFVPRKFEKNASIDETPEIEKSDLLETPNNDSLQASDSFEYANSEDRSRIKKMEELWTGKKPQWRSPHTERKHLLQQKKIKAYLDKRLGDKSLPKWESKDTDSDASDHSGEGWTIVKDKTKDPAETPPPSLLKVNDVGDGAESEAMRRSPSCAIFLQRLSVDPTLRAPFTIVPGIYTDQRAIAKKFGSILPVVRKPGHHVGPAKNPDCLCDHCKSHYANLRYRGRTRSVGDPADYGVQNWKKRVYPTTESNSNISVPSQLLFTDF